MESVSHYIR
ncbi:hypothetical protein Avbf_07588 [Armadillidium vulgare]|nr:hypothetical protein Avbf_07588 [Armadillidium vulgare]